MLKKFKLSNCKNFNKEICINFQNVKEYQFSTDCITDGYISKMLIYGRNATGKTNLGKIIMDIQNVLFGYRYIDKGIFLNVDSDEQYASFSYEFMFGSNEICYEYAKLSNQKLCKEQLVINEKLIFKHNFLSREYNFDNLKYVDADTAAIDRYLQSLDENDSSEDTIEQELPFLRWLINNVALENTSLLLKLSNFVKKMSMITISHNMNNKVVHRQKLQRTNFLEFLEKTGTLNEFEQFLNYMGIDCKLVLKKLPDGQSELYFSHNRLLQFFENISSGTFSLVALYSRIISVMKTVSFIYLDEFDAFYHYEMARNVIRYLKENYPRCQVILTTHNTNLMTNRLMRPDCLFILSEKGHLTALCDATLRDLREGHNLEKMYISGEFEKYE